LFADDPQRLAIGRAARAAFEREQGGVLRTVGIVERVLDEAALHPGMTPLPQQGQ
jgi:hypothetical protein